MACALFWAISHGFSGDDRRLDARAIVLAGSCWAHGQSPYLTDVYSHAWEAAYGTARPDSFVFAYPPTLALFVVPLSLFGIDVGLTLLDGLNLVALGACLYGSWSMLRGVAGGPRHDARRVLGLALAAAVGAISGTLLLGQTGFFVLCAMLGLWLLPRDRLYVLRIVCVIVASTKPTLTLAVLCFVAVTEPVLVATSAAVAGLLCIPVLVTSGGLAVPGQWLHALRTYAAAEANGPIELSSAQHLWFRLMPAAPTAILTAVAALSGVFLGLRARKARMQTGSVASVENLMLLLAISACCLPLHSYDMILIVPLAAAIPFMRGALAWYPLGILLAARPAIVARASQLAGLHFDRMDGAIQACGVVLITAGVVTQRMLGRSMSRPVDDALEAS